jgi:hypothetical protein
MKQRIAPLLLTLGLLLAAFTAVSAQASRASVSAGEVNGTFRMKLPGKFKAMANEIKILALGGGKLRFAMELIYPYSQPRGEVTANTGSLDGEAAISGDTAVFSSDEFGECKITFTFVKPGTLKVTQDGTDADCGFGHNVSAAGTYIKVNSRRPKFDTE